MEHATKKKQSLHSTFGGRICEYDFNGYRTLADIALQILSDQRFDETCKANAKRRDLGNQA